MFKKMVKKKRFYAKKILKNCTLIHLKVNYYSIVRTVKTQAPPGGVLTFKKLNAFRTDGEEALSNAFHETFPNAVHKR